MKYKLLLSITFVVAMALMGCSATDSALAPEEEIHSDENKQANEIQPPEQESFKNKEGVFVGKYENTVEDDEGNICLMYNTPIEEGIKTTVYHLEDGETNVSFKNEEDGSTFFNIICIDKSRSSSDPEEEINGCLNKLGEFDVKTTVVGLDGKEEQSYEKNSRIANKLEDIKTDIGDFSYYRVYYAIEPKDINKNNFTENAIFSNEDSIIVVKKLTGTSERIKSKSAKISIPELVKVLFNDVSYKDKLVADHAYNPEVTLAEIDGLEDIPESVEVASSEEVIDDAKEDVKAEDKHDNSEVEKPESKEKQSAKTDNVAQDVQNAPLSGSFYYTCVAHPAARSPARHSRLYQGAAL